MKGSPAMLWNCDVSDRKEVERMVSLYDDDGTRTVEPGMKAETGELLVRRCCNELGFATWEAYGFERNTWLCEAFSNREAAELWLSYEGVDTCFDLDDQLTQSVKRLASLADSMSGGRWTAGIQEYEDGREACRRVQDSSIALDKLAFYEKLKGVDMPVLLGALAVATEQNQRALGRLLADTKFVDMFKLPEAINPREAAYAEAKGKLREWKEGGHGDGMCYSDAAASYLDDYYELADEVEHSLLSGIDELIAMDLVDETGVYENPAAAIGTMFAEAALEHARADAEYFDEDFRMRATEGIDMWTAAREIAKSVPEAKPAEEEPAQTHGPKH